MPSDSKSVTIKSTSSPDDFALCAMVMAETEPWIKLGMDYDQCLKAFDGPLKEVYILKKGNEIVGFVIIQTHGTFKGYMQTVAITESNRGKGYGTQLLQFCEDRILEFSPNVFICVSSFNHKAIHLYAKFGFELVGELKDFVKSGFTELLLRKTVGPIIDYKTSAPKL